MEIEKEGASHCLQYTTENPYSLTSSEVFKNVHFRAGISAFHIGVPGFGFDPASCCCTWKSAGTTYLGPCHPHGRPRWQPCHSRRRLRWEPCHPHRKPRWEFLASGLALAVVDVWGVNQWIEGFSVFLSFPLSWTFCLPNKWNSKT